ncbi:hypothetical protein [uncultured Clostridium sp.]|uniref:hypothetical protein n=1 Tax=uncultured Clostridium sp. TaxID=59620 RepID=UPI00262136F5|nr:hypothetical protein [uncultured Clostridium sp.]
MKQILLLSQNILKVIMGIPLSAFLLISYYYVESFWDKAIMLLGLFLIIKVIKFDLTKPQKNNSKNM